MPGYLSRGITKQRLIGSVPSNDLSIICTIPCYNEPNITDTLESIFKASQGHQGIEVIVLVNHSKEASVEIKEKNQQTLHEVQTFSQNRNVSWIYGVLEEFEEKKSGVGRARKSAMDEACHRFIDLEKEDGIITCTDADTKVPLDYFQKINGLLNGKDKDLAYSFGFLHDLTDEKLGPYISGYELHLRYFKHAKDFIEHPHSCYTVGSSMAVHYKGYIRQMGMNIRKAGEDFYFLQKFAKAGKLRTISDIVLRPSSRISDRVPFGTGRAMGLMIKSSERQQSYAWTSFIALKKFFTDINIWYETGRLTFDESLIKDFLETEDYQRHLGEIKNHSADLPGFRKRFFYWFDSFKLMKYLHYARVNGIPDAPVLQVVNDRQRYEQKSQFLNEKLALQYFRRLDLSSDFVE